MGVTRRDMLKLGAGAVTIGPAVVQGMVFGTKAEPLPIALWEKAVTEHIVGNEVLTKTPLIGEVTVEVEWNSGTAKKLVEFFGNIIGTPMKATLADGSVLHGEIISIHEEIDGYVLCCNVDHTEVKINPSLFTITTVDDGKWRRPDTVLLPDDGHQQSNDHGPAERDVSGD